MSTFQRLTLIGMYNHDPELFRFLSLPAAYDVDTFRDVLLLDQGEKCVMYPQPDFFAHAVGIWSRKWAASLERIALALTQEYNPLHNYDRYEKWEDHEEGDYKNNLTHGGEDVTKHGGADTTTNTGTVTTTETGSTTEQTNNMTTEKTVSAYNSNAYQPDEKNTVNGSVVTSPDTTQTVTPDTTETVTHGATETVTHGASEDGTGDDRRDTTHEGHLYGNIGVTTSVQMLTAEVDARKNYNMYKIAAELFADDLLLMLY